MVQGTIQDAFTHPEITLWDLYFTFKSSTFSKDKWCNVEEEINQSFKSSFWYDVLNQINYFQENSDWGTMDDDWFFSWAINERYFSNNNWMWQGKLPQQIIKVRVVTDKEFFDVLFKELNQLEQRFATYLKSELEAKKSIFESKQLELLRIILNQTSFEKPIKVVSFNYTNVITKIDALDIQSINIHGVVDGRPIFGISAINNRNQSTEQFTKASRRLADDLPPLSDFIDTDDNTVVFYGTSLNDLDYDYYYHLIRLFNKTKKIYFCYSNYDAIDRKTEQIDLSKKLIDKIYSETFYQLRESGRVKILKVN